MHKRAAVCWALPALLSLAGCNLLDLTPTSEVVRTRVAGIAAEPAEIGLGESTTLTSLVVHPSGPAPSMGQIWFACLEAEGATGCLGLDLASALAGDADDDDDATPPDLTSGDFQFGVGEEFRYTAEGPQLEAAWAALPIDERVEGLTMLVAVSHVERSNEELGQLLIELGVASQTGDDEGRDAGIAELTALMDDALTAARRVVISDKTVAEPTPTECAAPSLAPNQNPWIASIRLHAAADGHDAGVPLGPITFVQPGLPLSLRPELEPNSAEEYLFIDRHAETQCRQEQPFFAWLVNGGGTFDGDYTFVAEDGDLDEVSGRAKINVLTLPEASLFPSTGLDLWLVVRDRRGGLTWTSRRLLPFASTP